MDLFARELLTTSETAQMLGVDPSQVRLLVRTHALAGERIGKQWFIGAAAATSYLEGSHDVGRPFSPRIAWSLLAAKEGLATPWQLHRQERARLRSYELRPLRTLAHRLSARAMTARASVGPRVFERLSEHPRWLVGGLSDEGAFDIAVIYVPAADYDAVLDDTNAVMDDEQPNLLIQVVDDQWWPFGNARRGAPVWNVVAELDRFERGQLSWFAGDAPDN